MKRRVVRCTSILVLIALLPGCDASAPHGTAAESAVSQTDKIEASLERAAAFLKERQSADGAWRSEVYSPFRGGDALTPIVLMALQASSEEQLSKESIARGLDYLLGFVGENGSIHPPKPGIAYPVYMAAGAILAIGDRRDDASVKARNAWLVYLRERQLTEQSGWQSGDIFYGGWSYAPELPRKLKESSQLSPLAEPNISATVFALEALRVAGLESSADEFMKARQFVERCQNAPAKGAEPTEFDDGGFFFLKSDGFRNKAGIAGRDAQGRERFASYGSATADGVRALLLCGEGQDAPRVQAAFKWLVENHSAEHQPGEFVVESARDSVYFYYCRSLALLLDEFAIPAEVNSVEHARWAQQLAAALMDKQRDDGSWANLDVEVREDDPLVATSLSMASLAACKRVLDSQMHHSASEP